MEPRFIAIGIKAIVLIPLFFVAACCRIAVVRWMKDGTVKRLLLRQMRKDEPDLPHAGQSAAQPHSF